MGRKTGTNFSKNNSQATQIPTVPLRTPMWDGAGMKSLGKLTRTWILFFEQLAGAFGGLGGIAEKLPQPINEVPKGTINGVNRIFTLTYAPLAAWLVLHLDNALEDPVSDYALSGNTITYTTAPQPGDNHHAWYLIGSTTPAPAIAATHPITPVTVYSTVGQGKVLYCANAAAIPSGWQAPTFNDSAWPAPVAQGSYPGAPPAGATWITDQYTARTGQPHYDLFRLHFTIGAGVITGCQIVIACDDWPDNVYVNGTLVYNPTNAGGTMYPAQSFNVPASVLQSGDNVLAIECQDNVPYYMSFCFVVTVF